MGRLGETMVKAANTRKMCSTTYIFMKYGYYGMLNLTVGIH